MIHEIKSPDWAAFCRLVTGQQSGAMVRFEVLAPDGIKTEQAANAAFQSMTFDQTDACNDVITLRLRDTREIVHQIIEPIQILLHPSATPGDFNPVQIEAENGVIFLTFHPAIQARLLGELNAS